MLDYDKLTMQIETNGALTPEDAVAFAARILQDQLNVFVNFEEPQARGGHAGDSELPSTRRCSRRWTNWNCRSVRPTA